MFKKHIVLIMVVSTYLFSGCTLVVDVKTPVPSSQKFSEAVRQETSISLKDSRVGEDKNLSMGRINFVLKNLDNELEFLGSNLEKELQSRGINVKRKAAGGDLELSITKYQIINIRSSGFHPLWTYTTFSADLKLGNQEKKIAFYWLADKTPIWSMEEVNDPCFNLPVSFLVKEVAAKINHHYFKKQTPSGTISSIMADIKKKKRKMSSLPEGGDEAEAIRNELPAKVLELGYTNNKAALEPLTDLLNDDDPFIRVAAIAAIGMIGDASQFALLKSQAESKDDIEQAMALKSIGDLGTPQAKRYLQSVKSSALYETQMVQLVIDLYL